MFTQWAENFFFFCLTVASSSAHIFTQIQSAFSWLLCSVLSNWQSDDCARQWTASLFHNSFCRASVQSSSVRLATMFRSNTFSAPTSSRLWDLQIRAAGLARCFKDTLIVITVPQQFPSPGVSRNAGGTFCGIVLRQVTLRRSVFNASAERFITQWSLAVCLPKTGKIVVHWRRLFSVDCHWDIFLDWNQSAYLCVTKECLCVQACTGKCLGGALSVKICVTFRCFTCLCPQREAYCGMSLFAMLQKLECK